jgi:thiamine pyrophosphokinase
LPTDEPDPGNAGGGINIFESVESLSLGGFFVFKEGVMSVLIFANGEMTEVEWSRPFLEQASVVIAADGGTRHLFRLDVPPDVVIGDMDSIPDEVMTWLDDSESEMIRYDPDKDETDLELALLYARRFDEEIFLFGLLGGRLDQTLANILLLAHPDLVGSSITLVEQYERAWLVTDSLIFSGAVGDTVSLVPLGGDVQVMQTTGLRWTLEDSALTFGLARGVSNEMTAVSASVEVASGKLLCIHTLDYKKE